MVIRLLNTNTLRLELFSGNQVPKYGILSHVWETDNEISFQEMTTILDKPQKSSAETSGYRKIVETCHMARSQDLDYAWVDTCCIDKTSSSELSEAINSMYRWYEQAEVCFAFLSDYKEVSTPDIGLVNCKWFTRGWCLQELLASRNLVFYDAKWNYIGSKTELSKLVSEITHIEESVLIDSSLILSTPIARRMSWAARRETTREEDLAYCLLGIFNINMTMLYGEGTKAFLRLQEEIVKSTNDLSIFAFTQATINSEECLPRTSALSYVNVFATSPSNFLTCENIIYGETAVQWNDTYSLTNKGLYFPRAKLDVDFQQGMYRMSLHCKTTDGESKTMCLQKVGPSLYAKCRQTWVNSSQALGYIDHGSDPYTKIEEDVYILTNLPTARQWQLERIYDYAIHVWSPNHDLSRALQIIQRASSSDRWDMAGMQYLTFGEISTVAFWKIFPKLARQAYGKGDFSTLPDGPVYLVCGHKLDTHTLIPSPWLRLYLLDDWRRLERRYGIITDLNNVSEFSQGSNTTDRVVLEGVVVMADIRIGNWQNKPRFELKLQFNKLI